MFCFILEVNVKMKKLPSKAIIITVFIISTLSLSSCSLFKKSTAEKAEVEQEDLGKAADAELRKREKEHYQMQTREAKKMMKKTKRTSKRINRNRISL